MQMNVHGRSAVLNKENISSLADLKDWIILCEKAVLNYNLWYEISVQIDNFRSENTSAFLLLVVDPSDIIFYLIKFDKEMFALSNISLDG